MAAQLKQLLNEDVVRSLAREVSRSTPTFAAKRFVQDALMGLSDLELMARGSHLAEALKRHLPHPFAEAAAVLLRVLEEAPAAAEPGETLSPDGLARSPFRYLPLSFYVAKYGLDDFESSMKVQHALTQRFTAEFSIRPFLERHPEATLRRLEQWTRDESAHVRRLVSEGTRPRLPWAPRLKAFQKEPSAVLALLERLKDDSSLYVRRSVANNLNDIGKDHPELLIRTCREWLEGASENRRWIVRHALRALIKSSHPSALQLLGVGERPNVRIGKVRLAPSQVPIGGRLSLSFELRSLSRKPQRLLVDYVVHFVKANGSTRPKVFKLTQLTLGPNEAVALSDCVTFQQLTTRKHHPGRHTIELQVNGVRYPLGEVRVTAPSSRRSRTSRRS